MYTVTSVCTCVHCHVCALCPHPASCNHSIALKVMNILVKQGITSKSNLLKPPELCPKQMNMIECTLTYQHHPIKQHTIMLCPTHTQTNEYC